MTLFDRHKLHTQCDETLSSLFVGSISLFNLDTRLLTNKEDRCPC